MLRQWYFGEHIRAGIGVKWNPHSREGKIRKSALLHFSLQSEARPFTTQPTPQPDRNGAAAEKETTDINDLTAASRVTKR